MNKIIIFCYIGKAEEFCYLMFEVVFIIYILHKISNMTEFKD